VNPETTSTVAIFNLDDHEQAVRYAWQDLGLQEAKYKARDLWEHRDHEAAGSISVSLPPSWMCPVSSVTLSSCGAACGDVSILYSIT